MPGMRFLRKACVLGVLAAPLLVVAAAQGLDSVQSGSGISATGLEAKPSVAARAEASQLPPCTGQGEPVNFAVFSLGRSFPGLRQSDAFRRCDRPTMLPRGITANAANGRRRHAFRANFTSFIYGGCKVGPSEESCTPPLEVQTWPACERNLGMYRDMRHRRTRIRGVPAAVFDGGASVELYTGRVTVVVFGKSPKIVARAARSLAPMSRSASFPPRRSEAAGASAKRTLPRPVAGAASDRLDCRSGVAARRAGI